MATQGFGCMGLSAFYSSAKTVTIESSKEIIHYVINQGIILFNTATYTYNDELQEEVSNLNEVLAKVLRQENSDVD